MGLRAVVGRAIQSAFSAVGDIALPMTVRHYGDGLVRNMNTGLYDRAWVDFPCSVVTTDTTILEGRADAVEADEAMLIMASDVPTISIGDMIFNGAKTSEVLGDQLDPTQQLHTIAVRSAKIKIDPTDQVATLDGGGASGAPDSVIDGGGA